MLTCGACGGGMSMISATHIGCSAARNKGTCENRRTIARAELERRVLGALPRRLMDPSSSRSSARSSPPRPTGCAGAAHDQRSRHEQELAGIARDLDRLVQAIIDGTPARASTRRSTRSKRGATSSRRR